MTSSSSVTASEAREENGDNVYVYVFVCIMCIKSN